MLTAVTKQRTPYVRAVLRFVASVMMVSGALLIADAGLTLAWQEPISAYTAGREQNKLEKQLVKLPAKKVRDKKERAELKGDAIARIELPAIHKTTVVVEGTDTGSLRKGPGHYPKTPLPGEGGTVGVAGHRTTYGAPFRTVDKLDPGEHIVVKMPYGELDYKVEKTQIVDPDATWITDRVKGPERLVLSACHPLYSASQRIVVFARLVNARVT